MNKYQIIANDYIDNDYDFSEKMEALAADYIQENELDIEVDDLWNDATADQARESLKVASRENGGIFYVDDFYERLLSY